MVKLVMKINCQIIQCEKKYIIQECLHFNLYHNFNHYQSKLKSVLRVYLNHISSFPRLL